MTKIIRVKKKKDKFEKDLEKLIRIFEITDVVKSELNAEGFIKPRKPEDPLDFTKLDSMVGAQSSDLGDLMVLYTRWFGYAQDMEARESAAVAIYAKCVDICKAQLINMMPKETKEVMNAKVEINPIMRRYSRKLLKAKAKTEIYKSMTRSIGRAVETVSREMTRRNK